MLRKILKHFKKKEKDSEHLQTDSVPELPRLQTSNSVPSVVPSVDQVNWNSSRTQDASTTQPMQSSADLPQSSSFRVSPFPSPLFSATGTPTLQLTISHSHGFQVGDVHNINVSNGGVVNYHSKNVEKANIQPSDKTTEPSCDLTSSQSESITSNYDKLKDWHISLISEHAANDLKALGQALELLPTELAAVELRSGGNTNQAVNEILKSYLWRYPDTSIGFISAVLLEAGHRKAVQQLVRIVSAHS